MNVRKNISLLFCTALILSACGAPEDGSLTISGTLPTAQESVMTTAPQAPSGSRSIASAVSKIAAFPAVISHITEINDGKIETAVEDDGSFSIDLDKETDWLLLGTDTNAEDSSDIIQGFVSLGGIGDSLVKIPAPEVNQNLELGELEASGDEFTSGLDLSDQDTNLSTEEIELLAATDDLYKSVENSILNFDQETGIYYDMGVYFKFADLFSNMTNSWSDPADSVYYTFKLNLETNNLASTYPEGFSFESLTPSDTGSRDIISLYPPYEVDILNESGTYSPDNPLVNEGTGTFRTVENAGEQWYNSDVIIADWQDGTLYFEFNEMEGTVVEEGYWRLTHAEGEGGTEEEIGLFNLSNTSPFNEEEELIIFVPALRAEVNTENRITGFQLKWYVNRNGTYTEIDNRALIGDYYSRVFIQIADSDGVEPETGTRVSDYWDMVGSWMDDRTEISIDETWYMPPHESTTEAVADFIIVDCEFGVMEFMFYFTIDGELQ